MLRGGGGHGVGEVIVWEDNVVCVAEMAMKGEDKR